MFHRFKFCKTIDNIKFENLRNLLLSLAFHERIKGDHYIFTRKDIPEIINIQPPGNGKAKSYQVKQVRRLLLKYKLHKEVPNTKSPPLLHPLRQFPQEECFYTLSVLQKAC